MGETQYPSSTSLYSCVFRLLSFSLIIIPAIDVFVSPSVELNELSDHTYELVSTWLNNLPRRILTRIFQRVGQMPEKENDVQVCLLLMSYSP